MRVLLIWEEVPETTRFYVLNDPDREELQALFDAHGGLINVVGNTARQEYALDLVNAALTPLENFRDLKQWAKAFRFKSDVNYWLSRWSLNEVKTDSVPNGGPYDHVVTAGIAL